MNSIKNRRKGRSKAVVGGVLVLSTLGVGAGVANAEARPAASGAVAVKPAADPLSFLVLATDPVTGLTTETMVTLTRFVVQNGQLFAVIEGTGDSATVPVTDLAADGACQILDLTLGPLHLDLLGLVVDLDTVNLQITAEPGAGNLLGNLLCGVAGLFDGGLLGQVGQILNRILGLLNISIV